MTSSQTLTQSSTSSQAYTSTPSLTPTQSQTPSITGFPLQPIIGNTNLRSNAIALSGSCAISSSMYRAVSFFLSETDPLCGPGKYQLVDVSLVFLSYSSDATGIPLMPQYNTLVSAPSIPSLSNVPAFYQFSLSSARVIPVV